MPRRTPRKSAPIPPNESHPAHPNNLHRSLSRNDVEISALSKLNTALRTLRTEIVQEYGDETLIEIATNTTIEDDHSGKEERLQQLATAFTQRMKLRRRLLNRLARRLYRVAYIMDGGDASPPLPPLYGDEIVRFKKEEIENNDARLVEEDELAKFVEGESKRKRLEEELRLKRCDRMEEMKDVAVEDEDGGQDEQTTSVVDYILRGDKDDKPILDQLKEYEVGYDKTTVLQENLNTTSEDTMPITTNPITNTTDPHEVSEEGEFLTNKSYCQRVRFSQYGLDTRPMPPRERSLEWKRWTREMTAKIDEQVTFEDIGRGVDVVFDREKRMVDAKKSRVEDSPNRGKVLRRVNEDGDGKDAGQNQGRGKVLKKGPVNEESSEPKEQNDPMEVDESEKDKEKPVDSDGNQVDSKTAKSSEQPEIKPPKRHNRTFSLRPVPSFYDQDLRRVKLVQQELIHSSGRVNVEKLYRKAQAAYDDAFKKSMSLQQEKAHAHSEYQKMAQQHKEKITRMRIEADRTVDRTKQQWQSMQAGMHSYRSKYGEEALQIHLGAKDVMKDMIDRVVLRNSDEAYRPTGTKFIGYAFHEAIKTKDKSKQDVTEVLAHVVDAVDRNYNQMVARNPEYIPPAVDTEHNTMYDPRSQETLAQRYERVQKILKQKVEQVSEQFDEAEKIRAAAWNEVTRYKTLLGNAAVSKSKKARKPNVSNRSVAPAAAPRGVPAAYPHPQSYNQQQQMFMQAGRPVQMMSGAPMQVRQPVQVNHPVQMMAAQMAGQGTSFNRVVLQSSTASTADGNAKVSQNAKYGYGDRYSMQNVQARIQNDGTVVPVTAPKQLENGLYQRPIGRQRKGMDWDAIRGVWIPASDDVSQG